MATFNMKTFSAQMLEDGMDYVDGTLYGCLSWSVDEQVKGEGHGEFQH